MAECDEERDERIAADHARLQAEMTCRECESTVLINCGTGRDNIRVIHQTTCAALARYQAGDPGRVPCGCRVTHRGPYKRKQATA